MDPSYINLIIGLLYVGLMGGLSLIRREGLSTRLILETLILTGICFLLSLVSISIHWLIFLPILYMITLRVRLLVDIGIYFAKRKNYKMAAALYTLAAALFPDRTAYFIVRINQGALLLQQGKVDEAIAILKGVVEKEAAGHLGPEQEAAVHYNLGVAYFHKKQDTLSNNEFNIVLESFPASEYARYVQATIDRKSKSHDQ